MRVKIGDTIAHYVTVTLDGRDVTQYATEADSVLGYVDALVTTQDGRPIIEDGEAKELRTLGRVEIGLRDGSPDHIREAFALLRAADGLDDLGRSYVELALCANALAAGLREFRDLARKYGVELPDGDGLYEEAKV